MMWPRDNKSDYLFAVPLFLFLVSQEVGGLSGVKGIAEVLLLAAFLGVIYLRRAGDVVALRNVIFGAAFLFVLSAVVSLVYSPLPKVSFQEMAAPLLKGMLLIPVACTFVLLELRRRQWSDVALARFVLLAFAISGVGQVVALIGSYVQYATAHGGLPEDPFFHRQRGGAMLIAFPFVLMAARSFKGWLSVVMAIAAVGLVVGVATSNARGAWLGFAVSLLYLMVVQREALGQMVRAHRQLAIALVLLGGAAIAGMVVLTPMGSMFLAKLTAGADSNARWGNGVWGATLDVIRQRPWSGYGYGDAVFAEAYNALAPAHPEWTVQTSIGAHNALLAHWVAAGTFGLLSILALFVALPWGAGRLIRRYREQPDVVVLVQCCLAAFIAYYLVRGQVEIARWNALGLLMGAMMWLYGMPAGIQREEN